MDDMNNVVYLKIFDNNKYYVGITNDFDRRMDEHNRKAFKSLSNLPIHKAMRKHNHQTEIIYRSNNYNDILFMEKQVITNFKELGYELYNLTLGGEGTLGFHQPQYVKDKISQSNRLREWSEQKRENMSKSCRKDLKYFENNSVQRSHFKRTCDRYKMDFNDFEEIFDKTYTTPKGLKIKKYFYNKYKEC